MEARLLVTIAVLAGVSAATSRGSRAAEPTKDECVDANESAQGLVRSGKLTAARARLLVCVAASCPRPVREDCAQRLADVEARTPTLVLEAKDDADHDLSAVRVTLDGEPFVDKLDGTALSLDPGEHRFTFEAEGLTREQRTLILNEGDKNRHERVVLVSAARIPRETGSAAANGGEGNAASDEGRSQRWVGLGLGGAGVVGLVVGGVFGLVSKATYDHATSKYCGAAIAQNDSNACSHAGVAGGDTARSQATVATIASIAGAVLIGGGAVVFWTAPKATGIAVGPAAARGGAALSVRGWW